MRGLEYADLSRLIDFTGKPCISIYMPTDRTGAESERDQIALKNMLRQAEDALVAKGIRSTDASLILAPGVSLLRNSLFWKQRQGGMAMFLAPGMTHIVTAQVEFAESLVVSDHFHVKQLLRLALVDRPFYILAASKDEVRVLRGDMAGIEQIVVEGVPLNMDEALMKDRNRPGLQVRSSGASHVTFHGHDRGMSEHKEDIRRYMRLIDAPLSQMLTANGHPLVFAGADYLFHIYKEVSTYPNLAGEAVEGSFPVTARHDKQLHARALEIVGRLMSRNHISAAEQYLALRGTGRTSDDVAEVAVASAHGRVNTAIISVNAQVWGDYDPVAGVATVYEQVNGAPGGRDMLDFIAIRTLQGGGTLHLVPSGEVPRGEVLAAIYRY